MANIEAGTTRFALYKLRQGANITNAVIFQPDKWERVPETNYSVNFKSKANGDRVGLYMNDGRYNFSLNAAEIILNNIGTDTYLLKIDSEMKPTDTTDNLRQLVQLENNNVGVWKENSILKHSGGGTGTGDSNYEPPVLPVVNEPADKGRFEIEKVGRDGEIEAPLAGAEFTLSNKSGNMVAKRISDDNGKVIFDNLEPGDYTLKETGTPEGYIKLDKIWAVNVDTNGITTVHDISPKNSALNKLDTLGISDNFTFPQMMALPPGTTNSDVSIIPSERTIGNSKVSTNARYLGNDEFEVKLDVTAGADKVVQGPNTDVVILIQEPMLTANVKNALINKINEYGDNVKVAVHIYSDRTGINSTLTFGTKSEAITKIRNSSLGYSYPNTAVRVQYALDTADRVFSKGSAPQKELISIVGNSVDKTAGITNQVNKLNNKNVNISSIYVGGAGSANLYMQRWSNVLGVPTVNASDSNLSVLNNALKVYGTAVQKAVENATFQVSFNNNFEFVGGSTITEKSNPYSGQWHSSYSGGTIGLRNGELTLNAGQTATMIFKVRATGDLKAGETYPLINDIIFKPNSTSGEQSIKAPQAKVAEGTFNLNIKSTHTGTVPNGAYGQFELFRTGSDGKSEKVDFYQFDLNKSIEISNLRLKDPSGQDYKYTVEHIWFSDPDIHSLGTTQGIEQNTITIRSEYRPGFKIDVDWGPLQPTGKLTIGLSNGETVVLDENNYNYYNPEITDNYPVLISVEGEEGYIHGLRQNSESSWSIVVRKKDSPALKVINEKESTKLSILKVDENDATKVLPGATFTLTGLESNYSQILTTNEEGKLIFTNLSPGTYILRETHAPEGYEDRELEWKIRVKSADEIVILDETDEIHYNYAIFNSQYARQLTYGYNTPAMNISSKIDKTNSADIYRLTISYKGLDQRRVWNGYEYQYGYTNPLKINLDTANFDFYDLKGSRVNDPYSINVRTGYDNQGSISFNIKPKQDNFVNGGDYYPIRSMSYANDTYGAIGRNYLPYLRFTTDQVANETTLTNVGNNTFEYTISNAKKKQQVEFTKVEKIEEDGNTNFKPLQGAVFELERKDGEDNYTKLEGKYTSGIDGKLLIENLDPGEYRLSEVTPPKGYRSIKGAAKEFQVGSDGSVLIKDAEGNFVESTEELQRIENIKIGSYEYSFTKKDSATGEPIDGVVFEIRNSDGVVVGDQRTSGVSSKPGEPNVSGQVTFTELTPGKYWIYEVNQKDGYIKSSKPLQVVVGEEYEVPENPENSQDVSRYFTLDPSKASTMTSTTDSERVVYPNETEGLFAKMHFVIDDSVQVKPGDTFTLQLSNNVNLDGIGKETSDSFDIYSAVGRIAKAEILPGRKAIKYTFTTALDEVDKITSLTINTPMFIDRYQVPINSSQTVTVTIGGARFSDSIYVSYDAANNNGYINNGENVKTYQLKLDPNTGEFTSVIYINPWHRDDGWKEIFFSANTDITINSIKAYKTTDGKTTLPWSYGINFDDYTYVYKYNLSNIYYLTNMSYNLSPGNAYKLQLGSDYNTDEYVVEVKGRVTGKTDSFVTYSNYLRRNRTSYWNGWQWVHQYSNTIEDAWETWVAYYSPDSESGTERTMYNQKNKIEYTKMSGKIVAEAPSGENIGGDITGNDQTQIDKPMYTPVPDEALQGAEFELRKGGTVIEGSKRTSGKDGKFFWEGLVPGTYEVWETKAPEGFTTPSEAVSSFEVNENGEIVNIKNNSTIIINEKSSMKFYLDKIWKDSQGKETRIDFGTLELQLQAPEGTAFPDSLKVDEGDPAEGRTYKITNISEDRKTITLEMDLAKAYEDRGIQIHVPSDWPAGDYTLTESKAPVGFMKTDEKYIITINQGAKTITYGDITLYEKTSDGETLGVLKIENERGIYPNTGGLGTILFVTVGVAMMTAAFIGYKRKRGDV